MRQTIKTGRVTALYGILDAAKYTKMDSAARTSLIRAMRPMRRVANDYNEYREDAVKRLRPDNYDEVAGLVQKFAAMDADALCDSNPDWTLGQCMELQDVLCAQEGGEA